MEVLNTMDSFCNVFFVFVLFLQGDQGQPQQQQITVQVQQPQAQPTQIQIVSADRIRFSCEECGLTFPTQTDLKVSSTQC